MQAYNISISNPSALTGSLKAEIREFPELHGTTSLAYTMENQQRDPDTDKVNGEGQPLRLTPNQLEPGRSMTIESRFVAASDKVERIKLKGQGG